MQGHARCTHVQVASATLGYITRTVATQLATNTVIIFFLYNGCLLLRPYRLWHMRPRSIRLIPSLSANAKLSKVEQNTHMAMQLRPLPQPCKEVLHPCTIEAMYHHIPGSGCPFDIWQQTWVRHEHIQGRNATECNTLFTSYNNPIDIRIIVSSYWEQQSMDCESLTPTPGATPKRGLSVPNPNSRGHTEAWIVSP